ncbi:hypothetical protein JHK82_043454 [Glycine max]|nr:hypothetical protein JHK82_043454 [Glycine max]KHN40267.1 hypothetical protein glysoja_000765 [Glycine soja]
MSIPESGRWFNDLVRLRSNLADTDGEGERLNQPNGMISHESESEKEDKLVTGGCAVDLVLEEEEKVLKRRSISEIFEMKEDVEEEKSSPEIEMVLKRLPFDTSEVSIKVTKFQSNSRP